MGNAFRCATHDTAADQSFRLVLSSQGSIQQFYDCMKVAEIMLDYPGNFVCQSSSFRAGERFVALPADAVLKNNELYFLLPMRKLHKRASAQDLHVLARMAPVGSESKAPKSHNGNSKVSPLIKFAAQRESYRCSSSLQSARSFSERGNIDLAEVRQAFMGQRSKSWKPNLQTIDERSKSR